MTVLEVGLVSVLIIDAAILSPPWSIILSVTTDRGCCGHSTPIQLALSYGTRVQSPSEPPQQSQMRGSHF